MSDVFIPLYVNGDTIVNMYKIALIRFREIDVFADRKEIIINSNVPLSELTCGKISQGTAFVQVLQSFLNLTLQEIISCPITTFVKLYQLLTEYKLLKEITNIQTLKKSKIGDIIQISCRIYKSPQLKKLQQLINTIEIENILNPEVSSVGDNIDKNALLEYLKETYSSLQDNHCIEYISEPLFDNYKAIIHMENKYLNAYSQCLEGKYVTIIGKVNCMRTGTEETCMNLYEETSLNLMENKLLNFNNEKDTIIDDNTTYNLLEIIPIIIYI
ncbi:MAG: hypothetical protein KID00_08960 [Clostridium argentinense]|nr:hypothetical protein [Clostridium argentinense]